MRRVLIRHWRTCLAAVWIGCSLLAFTYAPGSWYHNTHRMHLVLDLAGLVLLASGSLLRMWASAHVGAYKGRFLVTSGPYRHCRHPLYAGSLLLLIGLGLVAQSTTFVIISLALWVPAYIVKIVIEERRLTQAFGGIWQHYCRATPLIVPRIPPPRRTDTDGLLPSWRFSVIELPGIAGFAFVAAVLELSEHLR